MQSPWSMFLVLLWDLFSERFIHTQATVITYLSSKANETGQMVCITDPLTGNGRFYHFNHDAMIRTSPWHSGTGLQLEGVSRSYLCLSEAPAKLTKNVLKVSPQRAPSILLVVHYEVFGSRDGRFKRWAEYIVMFVSSPANRIVFHPKKQSVTFSQVSEKVWEWYSVNML